MPGTRKQSGQAWWVQRWLGVLECFGDEYRSRLKRGRADANAGRVWPLVVHPGALLAQVIDSYSYCYQVRIELPPLADAAWARVTEALGDEAASVAQLLAGELSPHLEDIFAGAGASLFPRGPDELLSTCTCSSWSDLCAHVAAAHYAFAEGLETQPFLLLALRGRTEEQVMSAVRARWAAQAQEDAPDDGEGAAVPDVAVAEAARSEAAAPEDVEVDALSSALRSAGFFAAGPELDALEMPFEPPPLEPPSDAALLTRLGTPPFATATEDVLGVLAPVYPAIARRAREARARGAEGRRAIRAATRRHDTQG